MTRILGVNDSPVADITGASEELIEEFMVEERWRMGRIADKEIHRPNLYWWRRDIPKVLK